MASTKELSEVSLYEERLFLTTYIQYVYPFLTYSFCYHVFFPSCLFVECLEKMNIQLDDVQSLALFSWFDTESTGYVLFVMYYFSVIILFYVIIT